MAGHTAVITGATQGLGRALAGALARRGWRLVVMARTAEDLAATVEALGRVTEVRGVVGDIRRREDQESLAAAVVELGDLQLLVNNAGTLGTTPLPPLLDYTADALRDVFDVNVVAQLGVIGVLRDLFADEPTIVNISSDAAVEPYPGWGGYGISKAALDHASRVLAAENPRWRVLSVDPGDMRTAMHQAAFPGEDISDRPEPVASVPGLLALVLGDQPSGRYAARSVEVAA